MFADVFDEVGPAAMGMDEAVTKAVVGNDTYHPTFSLVCGVQCQGRANGLNSRNYAARHPIVAVDSYTVSALMEAGCLTCIPRHKEIPARCHLLAGARPDRSTRKM